MTFTPDLIGDPDDVMNQSETVLVGSADDLDALLHGTAYDRRQDPIAFLGEPDDAAYYD